MSNRWAVSALLVVGVAAAGLVAGCKEPVAGAKPPGASPGAGRGLPSSMVALGDSITAGFAACVVPTPCPGSSWATGEGLPESHFRRIAEANPAIRGHARNLAAPKARVADLAAQVRQAVGGPADYVTILIGANDACHGDLASMTPTANFRSTVDSALASLRKGLPNARVLIVSIPDIARLWDVAHTNSAARRLWSVGICPALLANPESTAKPDADRRAAFRARIDAYNAQLEGACAKYGSKCRTDRGAAHAVRFGLSLLSPADFFHPNGDGQAQLAKVTYPGQFTW